MKACAISNVNFEAKKTRYIGQVSHRNLENLLIRMDEDTVYKSNEYTFESSRVKKLSLVDTKNSSTRAELCDSRKFLGKIPEEKQFDGNTCLTIGKTQLVIKNSNGEIVDYNKPSLTPWKRVLNQVNGVLADFNNLYNKEHLVMKHHFSVKGFTEKGAKILEKIKVK